MKFDGTSWRLAALVAAVSIGLGGCVGGGGKADVAEVITGTASDGVALANASITVTDSSKNNDAASTTITTDANGRFSFVPGARIYPFLLQVSSGDKQFFSVVLGPDKTVNISPATTVITQYALKAGNAGNSVNISAVGKLTMAQLTTAEQAYLQAVRTDSPLAEQVFDASPRTREMVPETVSHRGDAYNDYISSIDVSVRQQDGRMVVLNRLPVRFKTPQMLAHTGSDDLLTGGLGDAGLVGAAPGYSGGGFLSAADLRVNALYNQYHALADLTAGGGYGTLYSKAVKIPGTEYMAFADDGSGRENVSMLVQIPDSFNASNPCILVIPAPELRGFYGAMPTAEWGLRRGCAIAATDKGAGVGVEYVDSSESMSLEGLIALSDATKSSQMSTGLDSSTRTNFALKTPGRYGIKFAHSQQNPEKNWGRNVLDVTRLAFYLLNEKYGATADIGTRKLRAIKPEQTLVIVAGDGEGGSAALEAVEQDQLKLLDGVVALQPQAQLAGSNSVALAQGGRAVTVQGKQTLDYLSYANLYQPCAGLLSNSAPGAKLLDATLASNRCTSLRQKGLLSADTLANQIAESTQKLRDYGWLADSDVLHAASFILKTAGATNVYANSYGKFDVAKNLCDLSYGATDANGSPQASAGLSQRLSLFADTNGAPPLGMIDMIYNAAANGNTAVVSVDKDANKQYNLGLSWTKAISPSTGRADYAFDSAYCLRRLAIGKDPVSGAALSDDEQKLADAIKAGIGEVGLSAALQGRPAIVIHGRADSVFPFNHSARPYVARSLAVQGVSSQLRYYEVLNAQHFEGALGDAALGGFDTRYVPLRHYLLQSLDLMYNRLVLNKPLPDSQVIRTSARGGTTGAAPAITLSNAPLIPVTPAAGDLIQYGNSTLSIPN